jgi:hypothetical protein
LKKCWHSSNEQITLPSEKNKIKRRMEIGDKIPSISGKELNVLVE